MPNSSQDFETVWSEKIAEAENYHAKWEKKYMVRILEEYEEGFQVADATAYVLNMFFATIEVKTPALTFNRPVFNLTPKPKSIQQLGEQAYEYTLNNEDLINSWMLAERNKASEAFQYAIMDAWSRFGIIEVNYSADWINNPKIAKQKVKSDYVPGVDKRNLRRMRSEPEEIPVNEQVYIRNIPASHFRVSNDDNPELHRCDWCGYWESVRVEDLLLLPNLLNKERLRTNVGGYSPVINEEKTEKEDNQEETTRTLEFVRVWKIWDTRAQKRYIMCNGVLAQETAFEIFPFVDLRFKRRKAEKGFYPLPLTLNWIHPQNEINEVRNAHRNHRRRFKRLYTYKKAAFDDDSQHEIEKFINGPDGTAIGVTQDDPIRPVPNADLGSSANITMQTSFDDFNRISGTSSEMRGQTDRTTATQAAIANERASIREDKEAEQTAVFICRTAKKVLSFHQRLFSSESIPVFTNPREPFLSNVNTTKEIRLIDPVIDLGDEEFDYTIMLQLSEISPLAKQEDKQTFIEFLTLLSQFPQFGLSPTLIRELAYKVGYYNEKVIGEFQQMAQLQLVGMQQQAQQAVSAGVNGNASQNRLAQMSPPTQEEVRQQLNGQGVPIQ